jgi:hypothetical protein
MSLGIHRLWKDSFVSTLVPRLPPSFHSVSNSPSSHPANPKFKCLDVAGGTGDIALRILDRAREKFGNRDVEVEIVDLNEGMLDEGRKRVAKTLYYNSEWNQVPPNPKFHFVRDGMSLTRLGSRADGPVRSSPNRFYPWQRAIPPLPHRRQLDRSLHHRVRDPKLHLPPRRSVRGVPRPQARGQDRRARVWQGQQPFAPRVSKLQFSRLAHSGRLFPLQAAIARVRLLLTRTQGVPTILVPIHPHHGQDPRRRRRFVPIPRRVDRAFPLAARICPAVRDFSLSGLSSSFSTSLIIGTCHQCCC